MDDGLFGTAWLAPIPSGIGIADAPNNLPDETPLDVVRMPTLIKNSLRRGGFRTVGDVRHAPDLELRRWRGIGPLSVTFLRNHLGPASAGLTA